MSDSVAAAATAPAYSVSSGQTASENRTLKWVLIGVGVLVVLPVFMMIGLVLLLVGLAAIGASADPNSGEAPSQFEAVYMQYVAPESASEMSVQPFSDEQGDYDPFSL